RFVTARDKRLTRRKPLLPLAKLHDPCEHKAPLSWSTKAHKDTAWRDGLVQVALVDSARALLGCKVDKVFEQLFLYCGHHVLPPCGDPSACVGARGATKLPCTPSAGPSGLTAVRAQKRTAGRTGSSRYFHVALPDQRKGGRSRPHRTHTTCPLQVATRGTILW